VGISSDFHLWLFNREDSIKLLLHCLHFSLSFLIFSFGLLADKSSASPLIRFGGLIMSIMGQLSISVHLWFKYSIKVMPLKAQFGQLKT
jgi:hypothetical protein